MDNNTEKDTDVILEVKDLKTYFKTGPHKVVKAVEGVNFSLRKGKVLGIIGESGSGKSVTARSILRIVESPGYIAGGEIRFKGQDILKLPEKEMKSIRGNEISMIFQEPMTSLNPIIRCGKQIAESLRLHRGMKKKEAMEEAIKMMQAVGIANPQARAYEYPHQMSGGMRQRVMIAMAMSSNPKVLIADEPTTALDVTIQAQILHLLLELQKKNNMSIILITHDLELALKTADKIVVFYAGTAVEEADTVDFNREAALRHPYTRALFRAMPEHGFAPEPGIQPYVRDLPEGCPYGPRCPKYKTECSKEVSYVPYQGGLVRCICPGDENEILPGILSGPAGLKGQMTSEQITSEQMASGQRSGEYNAWGKEGVSL